MLALAILVGTDYNSGGIKGIGPKKALEFVKQAGTNPEVVFSSLDFNAKSDVPWQDIWNTFTHMPVTMDFSPRWKKIDSTAIYDLLVSQHDFSAERVNATLAPLLEQEDTHQQTSLGQF